MESKKLQVMLLAVGVGLAGTAQAEGLLDKVGKGVANITKQVGQTIESTAELVQEDGTPAEIRTEVDKMAAESLQRAFAEVPAINSLFNESAGYAVFDSRQVKLGVAAGYGRGVAVSNVDSSRTYMRMGTGGVGLQFGLGGFATKIIILFETEVDFTRFVTEGYDGSAGAEAMVIDETADESLRFTDGRSTFVLSEKGLMVNASVTGTKYWADEKLNTY